jgi:hypothetical protein
MIYLRLNLKFVVLEVFINLTQKFSRLIKYNILIVGDYTNDFLPTYAKLSSSVDSQNFIFT